MVHSVLSQLSKPVRFARRHGLIRAGYLIIHGVICRFGLEKWIRFSISDIFSAKVSDLLRDCRIPRAFEIRFATQKDLPAIETLGRKREHSDARLREGNLCLLLWLGSELKAMEWVAIGSRDYWEDWTELRMILRIPAGAGFAFDGRGRAPGAWGMVMRVLPQELDRIDIHTIYMRIDYANAVSLNSHRSAGYSPIGRVFHCGVGGLGFSLWRDEQGTWHSLPAKLHNLELATPSSQKARQQFDLFPMYRKW
jgi:hypothetical protein